MFVTLILIIFNNYSTIERMLHVINSDYIYEYHISHELSVKEQHILSIIFQLSQWQYTGKVL